MWPNRCRNIFSVFLLILFIYESWQIPLTDYETTEDLTTTDAVLIFTNESLGNGTELDEYAGQAQMPSVE